MRSMHARAAFLLLATLAAVPVFGTIAAEITLPVVGYLELPNDLYYRTELTITNHRDVRQYYLVELIADGHAQRKAIVSLDANETYFRQDGYIFGNANQIGALRVTAIHQTDQTDVVVPDPAGRLEASAYVVAERGEAGYLGTSRQEVAAIPSSEYTTEEMTFVGVRHEAPTYTNVGIVNLHPTQTETFYVQYKFLEPIAVVVPPLSSRQIRIPGPGNGGRSVTVYPEWSIGEGEPTRRTPWVAYASTVDGYTGDAFSGTRVPATSKIRQ